MLGDQQGTWLAFPAFDREVLDLCFNPINVSFIQPIFDKASRLLLSPAALRLCEVPMHRRAPKLSIYLTQGLGILSRWTS